MTNSIFSVCKYTKKLPYTKKKKDILMTKKLSHTPFFKKKLANTKKNSYLCNRNKQKK